MLPFATKAGLEDVAVTVNASTRVSTSPTVNGMGALGVSSLMVWGAMAERVGGSFTGTTVTRKLVLAMPKLPSLTLTVILAAPDWLVAGVTVTVRVAPLPPKTTLLTGTSPGLDEAALKVR